MDNQAAGKIGEDLAVLFLKKHGYKILERIRGGEIDIIAVDDDTLVYVEVKTRTSQIFGSPEEAVTPRKIKFLIRAAKFYRANRKNLGLPNLERIDVVAIELSSVRPRLKLIKNAAF